MKVTVTCVTQKRVLESFKFYSLTVNRGRIAIAASFAAERLPIVCRIVIDSASTSSIMVEKVQKLSICLWK